MRAHALRFLSALDKSPAALPSIITIGISPWDPIWARYEHTNNCAEIVHIVQGSFKMHTSCDSFSARAGDTLIVPDRTAHRDDFAAGSIFKVLHIQFRWEGFEEFFSLKDIPPMLALKAPVKNEIHRKALEMYTTFSAPGGTAESEILVRTFLFTLLVFIKTAILSENPQRGGQARGRSDTLHNRMLKQAEEYVRKNISGHIRCSAIAAHLGISPFHLSHIFSREKGFTLASFILKSRMERAAELLRSSTLRISEIAYGIGFEDPNYFAKCFKKHFGCAPSAYREIH